MSKIGNQLERFLAAVSRIQGFKDSENVANFLSDLGYRGVRSDRCDCPITRFVKDCVGDPDANIQTTGIAITYEWQADDDCGGHIEVGATEAQSAFVEVFDEGGFPDLTEAPNEAAPEPVPA